ncbi:hypothetical protein A0257_18930 [Hymenobacter psoromatis]|nr:hypothetical protein A0257_18930 [Hymenobacter psoromatis]
MGHAESQPHYYTIEEYLSLEKIDDMRHEFFEGEIFAMAGGTSMHNDLVQNFVLALRPKLRGSACRLKVETMRLAVRPPHFYTYPDMMVSCHADDQSAKQQYQHPVLIAEVLSPSTEAYDRGVKFNQYKQLPSLRHYLLVSQQIWLVEWFRKNEHGGWDYTVLAEADDALAIPELGVTLTLTEVYAETGIVPMRVSPAPAAETHPSLSEG